MDFLRPRLARHVLAATTIGFVFAGLGGACAAQDARGAVSQASYHGPYLSWSGKKAQAPAPDPDLAEARYAPAPNYDPGAAAPQAPRYAAPAIDGAQSRYGSPPSQGSLAPRSPEAYSSAAYAQPAPQAVPAPAPIPAPPPPAAPAPQPAAAYAAPSSAAAPAEQAQAPRSVRFYSLHREYGMTPDPIPPSTEGHTVLIGPPDNGPAAHDQDGDQDQDGAGDDGKPAAHGDGSGDKQSGDN